MQVIPTYASLSGVCYAAQCARCPTSREHWGLMATACRRGEHTALGCIIDDPLFVAALPGRKPAAALDGGGWPPPAKATTPACKNLAPRLRQQVIVRPGSRRCERVLAIRPSEEPEKGRQMPSAFSNL